MKFAEGEIETFGEGLDNAGVCLVRDNAGEIIHGEPALLERLPGADSIDVTACLNSASVHVQRIDPLVDICLRHRKGASPAGHMQNVAEVAVAPHKRGDDSVGTGAPPKNCRAGAVAEQNAGVAVCPVDDGAQLVRTDHQNCIVGMIADELLGHFNGVEETRAGCGNIEAGRVFRAKQPLNVAGGGRKKRIRGDGRNDDQIDLHGRDTSLVHGVLSRLGPPCGWCVHLGGDSALL